MAKTDAQAHQVILRIDGVDAPLSPSAVRVEERISGVRAISVELSVDPGAVRPQALLRKGAQIDVLVGGEPQRRFEGLVLKVRETWRGHGAVFTLTIGSPLDLLGLSTDCRIFQEMTVPEIVERVLVDVGFPSARIKNRLTETYPKLASCTQYGETMLAFISRLLEADGAFYFFEDGPSGLDLVLGDSSGAFRPASPAELPLVFDAGPRFIKPAVTALTELESLRATKVTLRDLDWEKPSLDLEVSAVQAQAHERELFDHPGGYVTSADGKRRARIRMDALVTEAAGVRGATNAPGICAGSTFKLEEVPRDGLGAEWAVTEITHEWSARTGAVQAWSAAFRAVPKSAVFRPRPVTPRPTMSGPQTAIVTGPSDQEIHTDAHGRVKLKFPWDRHASFDEKSSPWVRVAQFEMSGAIATPRIGWEVLVEFEHGDPDRPVVVGRLFNGTYLPPYPLPAKKTVSSLMSFSTPKGEGHNEIRIDDAAGAEHIHLHAQKDLELAVAHDRRSHVTTSRMVTIKADEAVTVKGNRSLTVKGLWDVTVAGNQVLSVEGERTKAVKKDEKVTVLGDRKLTVAGSHAISTESNATLGAEGDVSMSVGGSLSESADAATSVAIGADSAVTIAGAASEKAKKGKSSTTDGKRTVMIGGAAVNVSGKDLSVLVGGKRVANVGAAWTVTSSADVVLSSRKALELTVGAALTATGAGGISFKVGSSKVLVGQGGVVIEASKVKIAANGPASLLAAIVGSK